MTKKKGLMDIEVDAKGVLAETSKNGSQGLGVLIVNNGLMPRIINNHPASKATYFHLLCNNV